MRTYWTFILPRFLLVLASLFSLGFIFHRGIAGFSGSLILLAVTTPPAIAIVTFYFEKRAAILQGQQKIEAVEKKVLENPKAPQLAWELAQAKLENYLKQNLSQVALIFSLTTTVMALGFILIGMGAYQAFHHPGQDNFKASVLSSISGVIVSFIGGTFLVVYKSTMAQAKDYVTILERINAVGMSIQILELLDEGDRDLKHQTMAAVATQLLSMYSHETTKAHAASKS